MSKRPKGLQAQRLAKKLKEEETLTIEVEAGEDEVEELSQLYDSAIQHLNKHELDDSKMLFRGVVHECDKMIRIRNKSVPNATEEEMKILQKHAEKCPVLPAKFYLFYANALYHLSLVDVKETLPVAFLNEAIERSYQALQALADEPSSSNPDAAASVDIVECHFVMARILIQKLSLDPLIEATLESFKKEMNSILDRKDQKPVAITYALELAHHAHAIIDLKETLKDKQSWIAYNTKNWTRITRLAPLNLQAHIGLGAGWLALADEAMEVLEEDKEEIEIHVIVEYLKKGIAASLTSAIGAFETAEKLPKDAESPTHVYLLLGECHVHLGNLLDGDDQDDNEGLGIVHYRLAVGFFTKVKEIDTDALPEQFQEFLQEWEIDME